MADHNPVYAWIFETIRDFIGERCIIQGTSRINITMLYDAFKMYVHNKGLKVDITVSMFSRVLFNNVQGIEKVKSDGRVQVKGMCLKEDFKEIKPVVILTPEEVKEKQKKHHHELYLRCKAKAATKVKPRPFEWRPHHDEFATRANITRNQYFCRRRLRLVKFVWNDNGSVNWEETLKESEKKLHEYEVRHVTTKYRELERQETNETAEFQRRLDEAITQNEIEDIVSYTKLLKQSKKLELKIQKSIDNFYEKFTMKRPIRPTLKIVDENGNDLGKITGSPTFLMGIDEVRIVDFKNAAKKLFSALNNIDITNIDVNDMNPGLCGRIMENYDYIDALHTEVVRQQNELERLNIKLEEDFENVNMFMDNYNNLAVAVEAFLKQL